MRTGLGLVVVVGLLLGGTAACSDDDDGGSAGGTTEAAQVGDPAGTDRDGGDTGDDGAASTEAPTAADAVIQEYCDAVEAYVDALDRANADPGDTALQDEVRDLSDRVGTASTAVAAEVPTFSEAQQNQFDDCSDALAGAGG